MNIKRWSEVDISAPEVVLFIYLMFRKDYGYHIADKFRDAIEKEKWDNAWGVGSLKHSNKVDSLLVAMAAKNLLIELRPKWGKQRKNTVEADMANNPRRKYYRVNPNVLAMSHSVELTDDELKDLKIYTREVKVHGLNPDDPLIEAYTQFYFEYYHLKPAKPAIPISSEPLKTVGIQELENNYPERWSYSSVNTSYVVEALHLLELYAQDELRCILFINTIKKYDYLTILMTARTVFKEILEEILYFLSSVFYNSPSIIPLELLEEELNEWSYERQSKCIEQLMVIVNHLDNIIGQNPYIERGFKKSMTFRTKSLIKEFFKSQGRRGKN